MDKTQVFKQPKKKKRLKPNYYGIIVTVLLMIPLFFVILLLTIDWMNHKKEKRFEGELTLKITESELQNLQQSIKGCQKYEVNLMSATVRVSCEMNESKIEDLKKQAQELVKVVTDKFPVDKYFQNRNEIKMYDLEVYTYSQLGTPKQLIYVISKSSSSNEMIHDDFSKPKDSTVTERILGKPKKGK